MSAFFLHFPAPLCLFCHSCYVPTCFPSVAFSLSLSTHCLITDKHIQHWSCCSCTAVSHNSDLLWLLWLLQLQQQQHCFIVIAMAVAVVMMVPASPPVMTVRQSSPISPVYDSEQCPTTTVLPLSLSCTNWLLLPSSLLLLAPHLLLDTDCFSVLAASRHYTTSTNTNITTSTSTSTTVRSHT